jgi:hypothetical protein
MVMLQLKLVDRLFALWTAAIFLGLGYGLIDSYRFPEANRFPARWVVRLWQFKMLPRFYVPIAGTLFLLVGIWCLFSAFSPSPSTRPPWRW